MQERAALIGGELEISSEAGSGTRVVLTVACREGLQMIRVLICDDQTVVRDGLEAILSTDDEIEVVGVARHGQEAIDLVPGTAAGRCADGPARCPC